MSSVDEERPYLVLGSDTVIQEVLIKSFLRGMLDRFRRKDADVEYQTFRISRTGGIYAEDFVFLRSNYSSVRKMKASIDPGTAAFIINRIVLILSNSSGPVTDVTAPVWEVHLQDTNGKPHPCCGLMFTDPSYEGASLSKYIRDTLSWCLEEQYLDVFHPSELILFDGGDKSIKDL